MPAAIPYIAIALSVASAVYAASLDLSTDPKDTGSLVNKSGTRATRDVVYGRCLTGATPLWSNVNNSKTNELMQVFSTGIAVTTIHQLYIDDVAVLAGTSFKETTNTSSLILSGSSNLINGFEKQCTIQLRTGFPTGAPMNGDLPIGTPMQLAIDNSDGEWTNKMRGDYTSMVAIKSKRIVDDEAIRIMSENYSVNLEVSGVPVFDPRVSSDPSNKSYSRNPALCALDYITNTYYGMGIGFDKVDINSFATVANHCDANNFFIDGQLNQGDSFATNLEHICNTAQIHLFIENGKLVCRAETIAMPSWSFNEDNILKGTLKVTEQTSDSYANVISVNYKNSELDDKEDVFTVPANIYPIQSDPAYPTKPQVDGYIATTELDMPMTRYKGSKSNDADSPMKKFANIELRRQDFQKEIEFDVDREEYNISVFDVIEVSDDAIGWNKKQFRITGFNTKISETDMNIVTLKCKEYSSSIYSGSMDGTPPSTKPLPPVTVSPPTNLKFTLQDLIVSGSATLSWSRTWFETNVQYDVEFKRASESTWTRVGRASATEWKFPSLYPDTYDFRVATWSNLYGSSNYTELTDVVISKLGTFPSVTGLACDTTTQDFKWTWDDMLDSTVVLPPDSRPDAPSNPIVRDYFSHYQVDIFDGTTLIDTYQATTNLYDYTYSLNRSNGILRTIRANVYIVAKDGTKSQLGNADLTATNPQQSAPTGIVDSTELSNTLITWNQPTDFSDYRATRFYQSTTQGFVPSQANFLKEQVGTLFSHIWNDSETHYIRFAHVDVFGNDSEAYSHEIAVVPVGIDDLLPIDPDFAEIRDPKGATGKEQVIKTADGEYVAAIGLYSDAQTKSTKILMAAEQILMGVGGRPFYDETKSYVVGNKVLYKRTPEITALYECKADTTGNLPTDTTYWTVLQSNADQAVFGVNESGRVLIENAVIADLTSDNIKARSIVAGSIEADTITGNEISAATTITAGVGNNVGVLDGAHATARIYAGNADPTAAPFRVDQDGTLTATNAIITGRINASSGHFNGQINLGKLDDDDNYIRLYAHNGGSDSELIRMFNDGKYVYRQWANGRTIWYKSDGTSYFMDINPRSNSATFSGSIYAEKVVGDIVTARRYSASAISRTSAGTTTFDTVKITTKRPYDRTLILSVSVDSSTSVTSTGGTVINSVGGHFRVSGTYGTFTSSSNTATARAYHPGSGGGSTTVSAQTPYVTQQVIIPIGANTTGTITMSLYQTGSGTTRMQGVNSNSYHVAQLFRNGGDLG